MRSFSQREGIEPVRAVMQVDSMDDDLRSSLWNALDICYWRRVQGSPISGYSLYYDENKDMKSLVMALWMRHFKRPLDTLNLYVWHPTRSEIREYFFGCKWNKAYDFIEFVVNNYPDDSANEVFMGVCNSFLEAELSGYRFVGGKIARITADEEITEIEEALQVPLRPVQEHLRCSLNLLADRENRDYRNSIKEAISAIEAICKLIVKDDKARLGQALREIESKVELHPALKSAFDKLYGYTSDEGGIRHSLVDESDIGFEDAKFMLVSCSAFINYLVAKSSKAGIKL